MMTDPIADMLTQIRNANRIGRRRITMPASRLKVRIAEVLVQEGFLARYEVLPKKPSSDLAIDLKFGPDGEHVIRSIDRVSKPGRRVYAGAKNLPGVLRGMGVFVLSTPMGVVSDRAARKLGVGGEVLCKVY